MLLIETNAKVTVRRTILVYLYWPEKASVTSKHNESENETNTVWNMTTMTRYIKKIMNIFYKISLSNAKLGMF